jgi:hypothetical protein
MSAKDRRRPPLAHHMKDGIRRKPIGQGRRQTDASRLRDVQKEQRLGSDQGQRITRGGWGSDVRTRKRFTIARPSHAIRAHIAPHESVTQPLESTAENRQVSVSRDQDRFWFATPDSIDCCPTGQTLPVVYRPNPRRRSHVTTATLAVIEKLSSIFRLNNSTTAPTSAAHPASSHTPYNGISG